MMTAATDREMAGFRSESGSLDHVRRDVRLTCLLPGERVRTGEALVCQNGPRVQVRTQVRVGIARCLLGRHVGWCA